MLQDQDYYGQSQGEGAYPSLPGAWGGGAGPAAPAPLGRGPAAKVVFEPVDDWE